MAIVTGGNGGLGLAMARGLARAGASIAVAAQPLRCVSSASDFVTGAALPVDGGYSARG